MSQYAGMRVTVMGLGRFGGGIGVTKWLASQGAKVVVTDIDNAEALAGPVSQIQSMIDAGSVSLRLGGHEDRDFSDTDMVVASAAVPKPWENRFIRLAEERGHAVTTEIALLVKHLRVQRRGVIGVTGSVGKSTTSAMVHHALKCVLEPFGRQVVLGGNIGGSLLGSVESLPADAIVVLELSSAMLYWIDRCSPPPTSDARWAPGVALVTNLAPNHIDWHGSLDHYTQSKQHLIRHQRPGDTCVLGQSVSEWRELTSARCVLIDPARFPGTPSVPGAHNKVNAAGALLAACAAAPEVDPVLLGRAIRSFTGLPHRLQRVHSAGCPEIAFYNDSKSTTPEASLTAVNAVTNDGDAESLRRVHLIVGGYDKGADLGPLASLAKSLAGLYCIGVTGPAIARQAGGSARECGTLDRAMTEIFDRIQPGDIVLLSPGCASWDQYTNFEARGDEFVRLASAGAAAGRGA